MAKIKLDYPTMLDTANLIASSGQYQTQAHTTLMATTGTSSI